MKPLHQTREHLINGRKIHCPVCGYNRFWTRPSGIDTSGEDERNFISGGSKNEYICGRCGHIPYRFVS